MTFLLHGNNIPKISAQLTSLKKQLQEKGTEKLEFDKGNFDKNLVRNALSSPDFFGNTPCIIINLTEILKKDITDLYTIIKESSPNSKIILYSYKTLAKTNDFIKNTDKLKINAVIIEEFDNKDIFKYSDGVIGGNRNMAYKAIKNLLDDPTDPDPIPVIAYLHTVVRNMLLVNIESPKSRDINPFVLSKISGIAKKTPTNDLKYLMKSFYNIDKDIKQGRTTPEIALNLITEKVITCLYDKKIY